MRRRQFIAGLGGVLAMPRNPLAQQSGAIRRVGVLTGISASDAETKARSAAFEEGLQQLGWSQGRNLQVDYRSAGGNATEGRRYASELIALKPDVILAIGTINLTHLLQQTKSIPIVFTIVTDPVGAGLVESLSRPGGNATGFMMFEYSLAGKWLELLKQVAPGVTRAAVLRDPTLSHGIGQFAVLQSVAPSLNTEAIPIDSRAAPNIEQALAKFATTPHGGLIVTASPSTVVHRELIIELAARHKLPAVYLERFFATSGGLISYGPNLLEEIRRAATYVDRVLKGEMPSDLPVQAPTNYVLTINLKTAKTLGLNVPPALLARADEVIE